MAIICPAPEAACVAAMHAYAARYAYAAGPNETVYLARRHFGVLDRPVQYQILIIPPESH